MYPATAIYDMEGDLLVADHLHELAEVPDFQEDVSLLVRYIYRPHLREQLGRVLFELAEEAVDAKARASARRVLVEYGYLPGADRDWMSALPYSRGP